MLIPHLPKGGVYEGGKKQQPRRRMQEKKCNHDTGFYCLFFKLMRNLGNVCKLHLNSSWPSRSQTHSSIYRCSGLKKNGFVESEQFKWRIEYCHIIKWKMSCFINPSSDFTVLLYLTAVLSIHDFPTDTMKTNR